MTRRRFLHYDIPALDAWASKSVSGRKRPLRIAAIDIGTNSVHMIIVDATGDMGYDIVDREKDMIKLGAGTFRAKRLSQEAYTAGIASLGRFKTLIDRHGVDVVLAVATSAVREAENGAEFLDAVRRETGLSPRMISGDEEAHLIHEAVRGVIDLSERKALVIDIGGGSVEAIVGHARDLVVAESLSLGVLRLRDLIGEEDPLPRDARRRLESIIRERASGVFARAREAGFELMVGTSGTILDLGLAVHRGRGHDRWASPDGRVVQLEDLRDLAERLALMNAAERAKVSGIDEHRADAIHLGALLLVQLMELAKVYSIVLCDVSIREGLVLDFLARGGPAMRAASASGEIRRRSVLALARRCGQDGAHARRVADVALQIFDQTKSVHQLSAAERRILEYASLLHDIGRHIDFERHEHHAYYLIRFGGLRGFTESEIELIALVARYHRKASPKARHREYAALPPRGRRTVRVLAGVLRLAEGLERGHAQVVDFVRCDVSPGRLRIAAHATGDAALEVWAARRKSTLLSEAIDRDVLVEAEEHRVELNADA